jgi:hypothetical protein
MERASAVSTTGTPSHTTERPPMRIAASTLSINPFTSSALPPTRSAPMVCASSALVSIAVPDTGDGSAAHSTTPMARSN